jgi:hypothetical protein
MGVLILVVFFSLRAESRVDIMLYPLALFPLASVMNKYDISVRWSTLYVVASLALSHFWYKLNVEGTEALIGLTTSREDQLKLMEFPIQRNSMHYGHWQCDEAYLFWGVLMLISLCVFYKLVKKIKESYETANQNS